MDLVTHSGVVPYLIARGQPHFVLITNRSGKWAFPKGVLEAGLQPWESAAKEAFEEAGVIGRVTDSPTTIYHHQKFTRIHPVVMYLLAVDDLLEAWAEEQQRSRTVLPYASARELLRAEAVPVLDWANGLLSGERSPTVDG